MVGIAGLRGADRRYYFGSEHGRYVPAKRGISPLPHPLQSAQRAKPYQLRTDAGFSADQARAYAWLAQRVDGHDVQELSPSAQREIPTMRLLNGERSRRFQQAVATVTPRMVFFPIQGRDYSAEERQALKEASGSLRITETVMEGHINATMHIVPNPGTVAMSADNSHSSRTITGDGVWHALEWTGGALTWNDESTFGHVLSIVEGDVGTIRLDDGLVVPGRYYRIHDGSVLEAGAGVKVHIRPLTAVGVYYERAAGVPEIVN